MKIITANCLSDGRVIYWGAQGQPTPDFQQALILTPDEAEALLAKAAAQPDLYVNPYLTDVTDGAPSGRDRLKETIRSKGPTAGHSLMAHVPAEVA